ncbi:MAG: AMP-binding protein [Chromatiales bacterium]
MSQVLQALSRHACARPHASALVGDSLTLSYGALEREVQAAARRLTEGGFRRIGLLMDNGPGWAVADLAARQAGALLVPLPPFFSDAQIDHVATDTGLDVVLTDMPSRVARLFDGGTIKPLPQLGGSDVWALRTAPVRHRDLPPHTAKVTYTSGTTGSPKGVCLSQAAQDRVASSLATLMEVQAHDVHLALQPLGVLLENIAGLDVSLLRGVACTLPPLARVGIRGAAGVDAAALVAAIADRRASSVILVPETLRALVAAVESGAGLPSLRFAAVGGAPLSPVLVERAWELGLPAYEGYGLSECASVVAVNTPGARRLGSVGRPLPHARLRIAPDGEILIAGTLFEGYVGERPRGLDKGFWASGDIGRLDDDGFLHVTGRKKHLYITAFGRNVSPEWAERELNAHPAIAQAVVFGEGRPWGSAVVVPRAAASAEEVDRAITALNGGLPDYARIGRWVAADEPFSPHNRLLTSTGRPRREAIWHRYGERIDEFYRSATERDGAGNGIL